MLWQEQNKEEFILAYGPRVSVMAGTSCQELKAVGPIISTVLSAMGTMVFS